MDYEVYLVRYDGIVVASCGISSTAREARDRVDMFMSLVKEGYYGNACIKNRYYKSHFKVCRFVESSNPFG